MFRYSKQEQIHFINDVIHARKLCIITCCQHHLSANNVEEVIFSLKHARENIFKYSTVVIVGVCNNRWGLEIECSECTKILGVQFC